MAYTNYCNYYAVSKHHMRPHNDVRANNRRVEITNITIGFGRCMACSLLKCNVMAHINPLKLYYAKKPLWKPLWKTPQLACQAKGLCRALPVHACWCTCSCRVAAVQCQRGTCPCKATVHHLTSPPPWYALLRGKHRGPTSTTLHWGKPATT